MTIEDNRAVIHRFREDVLTSRDLAALDEISADGYVDHAAFPDQGPGREGLKQRLRYIFDAFDPHWTVHHTVAERDIVAVHWTLAGRHRGEFLGLPPSGREFTLRGVDIYRVTGGLVVEHWNVVDLLVLYQAAAGPVGLSGAQ